MQRVLSSLIILLTSISTAALAVQVDGYCFLEGEQNHAGTKVVFLAASPSAESDSVFTALSGEYQRDLVPGLYDVYFSHNGFYGQEIIGQNCYDPITLQEITLLSMGVGIPISGPQSGILESATYLVVENISVTEGDTLVIEPGAIFLFDGIFSFTIGQNSILQCRGTLIDSIKFTPNYDNGIAEWGGINIYGSSSDNIIEYSIITGSVGSGISCFGSPTISNCSIIGNYGDWGGGIYCGGSPTISNCNISGNSGEQGGGICCEWSSATIINCVISGNSVGGAGWLGGGIYCDESSPVIRNCTISGNSAQGGGGIYSGLSNTTISNCSITDNTGRGISGSDDIEITYSDVYNNSGGNFGGFFNPNLGVLVTTNTNGDSCDAWLNISLDPLYVDPDNGDYHLQEGSPCIDAGDPDSPLDPDDTVSDIGAFFFAHELEPEISIVFPNGGEEWWVQTDHPITWTNNFIENVSIELYDGSDLSLILASDISNSGEFLWTIPEDLTPGKEYTIRVYMTSDPAVEDISDGPFQVLAPPFVTLTPFEPPIIIGPNGGGYWYWMVVLNPTNTTGSGQAWSQVILPNGYTYGPLFTVNITLGPGETYAPATPYGQWVPSYAPAGTYEQVTSIGVYPNLVMDTDSFTWEKLPGVNTSAKPVETWSLSDWPSEPSQPGEDIVAADPQHESALPTAFKVSAAYPNPFNATTTVTVSLPEAALLDVSIFNVMGQKVATLADGQYSAGLHKLTLTDPSMATGIYFIHTSVPGKLEQVQKVVLVR